MLTSEFQEEKKVVLTYYEALESAPNEALVDVIAAHVSDNYLWRGFHPFDEKHGAASVAEAFWRPFSQSRDGWTFSLLAQILWRQTKMFGSYPWGI